MKDITKKQMMEYIHNGKAFMEMRISKSNIMENPQLAKQINGNLKNYNEVASRMNMNLKKSDLRQLHKELVTITSTVKTMIENPDMILEILEFSNEGEEQNEEA